MHAYPKVFDWGHKALEQLWNGTVFVQEKIDGSPVSFGVDAQDGKLHIRSHRADITYNDYGMFAKAIEVIHHIEGCLVPGWTYRGEFLGEPKQNTLAYGRVPKNYIILFDVDCGNQDYAKPSELAKIAELLDFESVPLLAIIHSPGGVDDGYLREFLERDSILGGVKVEGIVLKNYKRFGPDGKSLMGKLVSKDFQEKHKVDWKQRNPNNEDFIASVIAEYATEARWVKAIQHLREDGILQNQPQDIPLLLEEVNRDVLEECGEEIAGRIFKHFWKKSIARGLTRGLPEWYKAKLAADSQA